MSDFVKIMRCQFCGEHTNALALHKHLKNIKEEVFDPEPCEKCIELFKTHKFFIGDCGHSGFVSTEFLKKVITKEAFLKVKESKIFMMKKCFKCLYE